ncbi:hypothetical protein [Streptomyces sp. NPDC101181]|uniref:hypothetical protein n=1 Tax=Streptomyces sp. NPDC101181 TaxID=3366125 RepID=UPI0038180AE8
MTTLHSPAGTGRRRLAAPAAEESVPQPSAHAPRQGAPAGRRAAPQPAPQPVPQPVAPSASGDRAFSGAPAQPLPRPAGDSPLGSPVDPPIYSALLRHWESAGRTLPGRHDPE